MLGRYDNCNHFHSVKLTKLTQNILGANFLLLNLPYPPRLLNYMFVVFWDYKAGAISSVHATQS